MTFVHFISFVFVNFLLNPPQNTVLFTEEQNQEMLRCSEKLFVLAPLHKG